MSSNEVSVTLKKVKKGLVLLHTMKLKYAPKLYINNNLICFLMTLSLVKDNAFNSVRARLGWLNLSDQNEQQGCDFSTPPYYVW
ncbi:unnamed protein product [Mucor circinelloides]